MTRLRPAGVGGWAVVVLALGLIAAHDHDRAGGGAAPPSPFGLHVVSEACRAAESIAGGDEGRPLAADLPVAPFGLGGDERVLVVAPTGAEVREVALPLALDPRDPALEETVYVHVVRADLATDTIAAALAPRLVAEDPDTGDVLEPTGDVPRTPTVRVLDCADGRFLLERIGIDPADGCAPDVVDRCRVAYDAAAVVAPASSVTRTPRTLEVLPDGRARATTVVSGIQLVGSLLDLLRDAHPELAVVSAPTCPTVGIPEPITPPSLPIVPPELPVPTFGTIPPMTFASGGACFGPRPGDVVVLGGVVEGVGVQLTATVGDDGRAMVEAIAG